MDKKLIFKEVQEVAGNLEDKKEMHILTISILKFFEKDVLKMNFALEIRKNISKL